MANNLFRNFSLLDQSYTKVLAGQGWRQRSSKIPSSLLKALASYLMGHKVATAAAFGGASLVTQMIPGVAEIEAALAGYLGLWLAKKLMQGRDAGLDNMDGSGKVSLDYGKLMYFRSREKDWHTDGINKGKAAKAKKEKDSKFDEDTGSHTNLEWKNKIYGAADFENAKNTTAPQFVFMDCGRWKGEARDFGLVWGRHVYLCHYEYTANGAKLNNPVGSQLFNSFSIQQEDQMEDRLDYQFFKAFEDGKQNNSSGQIKIQAYTMSIYGDDDNYDWSKATVIIPDLHLMNMDTGKTWYKWLSPGYFNLDAEVALLNFAEMLVKIGNSKLNVVQIGDSYDLWVGYGNEGKKAGDPMVNPFFAQNEDQMFSMSKDHFKVLGFSLPPDAKEFIGLAIKYVQRVTYQDLVDSKKDSLLTTSVAYKNWRSLLNAKELAEVGYYSFYDGIQIPIPPDKTLLNPAEVAFRVLEKEFAGMKYIYGNHDNYLIDPSITSAAGLKQRVAIVEDGYSLFIEHAHRMEADFMLDGLPDATNKAIPKNHDGSVTGFIATNDLFEAERTWSDGDPTNADDQKKNSEMQEFQNGKSDAADMWAGLDQQPTYHKKFAEHWMGKVSVGKKPYNIMVIGHTHMPALFNYYIEAPVLPPPQQSNENEPAVDPFLVPVGDGLYMEDPWGNMR